MESKKQTQQQLKTLRGLGHKLSPLVIIGKEGIDGNLVKAMNEALDDHELVKVRILDTCPEDRAVAAKKLAAVTKSLLAHQIGKIFLLFRESAKKAEKDIAASPKKEPRKSVQRPKLRGKPRPRKP